MIETTHVVCFGEVLWDVLPDGRRLGGAPTNVAYHLSRLGLRSTVISRVGNDALGAELLDLLADLGLDIGYIQCDDTYRTSEVVAMVDVNGEVTYEIVAPVAWDFIDYENRYDTLLQRSDMLVFGSLSARNERSRKTLYRLLESASFRLFDVNLRAPYYAIDTVVDLLKHADAVKVNNDELEIIGGWLGNASGSQQESVRLIQEQYGCKELIVTKGALGVSYYVANERYDYPAYDVTLIDTIGSGDAFLAAFISKKLAGEPINDALDHAVALGAFVAAYPGANPDYKQADLNHFIWKSKQAK